VRKCYATLCLFCAVKDFIFTKNATVYMNALFYINFILFTRLQVDDVANCVP
jgi:hypothetical protein